MEGNAFYALVAVAPPDAPTNLSLGEDQSTGHSLLSWDASTHPDVEEYEVYREEDQTGGFSLLDVTTETEYVDEDYYPTSYGQAGGTVHHVAYKVKAVDDTELTSDFSDSISDLLSTVPDVEPPPDKAIPIITESLPTVTELLPSYPNPFNAMTELRFSVSEASDVRFVVFDLLGRKILDGELGQYKQGYHTHILNMSDMAAGVYFTQVQIGNYSSTQKIILLR
jgi:Secretion system C-terminal sorting domain